uniref:Prospero domain-containing protein n=1 Tax=Heterorhabditis bacteriophora TaxID=37862 RepID=A0A1I7X8D2_HETBA
MFHRIVVDCGCKGFQCLCENKARNHRRNALRILRTAFALFTVTSRVLSVRKKSDAVIYSNLSHPCADAVRGELVIISALIIHSQVLYWHIKEDRWVEQTSEAKKMLYIYNVFNMLETRKIRHIKMNRRGKAKNIKLRFINLRSKLYGRWIFSPINDFLATKQSYLCCLSSSYSFFQRHDLAAADTSDEIDPDTQLDDSETTGEDNQIAETRTSNESANSTSSSSKRKSFMPQRNMGDIMTAIEEQNEPEQKMIISEMDDAQKEDTGTVTENRETELPSHMEGLSALQSQLNTPNIKISEMFETQKRLYNNLIEQQKKMFPQQQTDVFQEKVRTRDYSQLAQSLKTEIIDTLSGSIDKVCANNITSNTYIQYNYKKFLVPPNGIFPSPFNTFNPLAALNSLRRPFEDDCPKKKRSKVINLFSYSLRFAFSFLYFHIMRFSYPTPLPSLATFHQLWWAILYMEVRLLVTEMKVQQIRMRLASVGSTLTPVHLRKAKLMFFYTRYPNSTLLKSYFPDVRFNKNNTAQLVKWFSNFREFYYIQMDKYARQALAEGISSREEIVVTMESEIFKTLNQHYNRNNHIQVINRLDDHIPEYFKDPNFLERLE